MNQLKMLRKKHNVSQAAIADILGIRPAAVSKYETGRVPLSEDTIEKICNFLGVSADELLGLSAGTAVPIHSKAAGQIYPASVTLEDYLSALLNTIARQKKQMEQTIRNLYLCGIPAPTIARVTAIAEEEILKLLEAAKK